MGIRIVLVSHGEQAKGMMNTLHMVLGPQENIAVHCLMAEESADTLYERLKQELEGAGAGNVLFITDLLYGTPFNTVNRLAKDYDVHHLTGANLSMVMTAVLERTKEGATCESVAEAAVIAAEGSINDVRKLLRETESEEEEEEV